MVTSDLIERARSGEGTAFEELVGPFRHEVQLHCYRMLVSLADAEDALQETLTAAWRGLPGFEGRASIRTWLYRIATSRCMNMLRAASRRPVAEAWLPDIVPPEPTRLGEVVWLEPYPDQLLAQLADSTSNPEGRYEARESVSLAFITALQLLPPRQRAVLILRDVLDYSARDVAGLFATTEQSVTSALKRARGTITREMPREDRPPLPPNSAAEQALLGSLVRAFEDCDVDGIVELMTHDAWVRMPPVPRTRELVKRFFATVAFRPGRRYRLIPTRANHQPAYGIYLRDPVTQVAQAFGLFVVTLAGDRVSAITRFDNSVFPRFGLPRTLPD